MKRTIISLLSITVILFFAGPTLAGKSLNLKEFANQAPSGPHYNLNIIFKKAEFTCPDQEYYLQCPDAGGTLVKDCSECLGYVAGVTTCTLTGTPIYGGVIFAPQVLGDDDITIEVESGKKGPKGNPGADSIEVTDWCTESLDGNGASFRLPSNDQGYAVYARITGDPKQNPMFSFTNPQLKYMMSESGEYLSLLGFVTDGVFDSYGEEVPSRYDSLTKGKGVRKRVDITPLFLWKGNVCYFEGNDYDDYCLVDGELVCTEHSYCCLDAQEDGDYEHCDPLVDACPAEAVTLCCVDLDSDSNYDYCDLLNEVDEGTGICPPSYDYYGEQLAYETVTGVTYEPATAWCRSYGDPENELEAGEWIFNISDFVGMLFDIEPDKLNTGSVVLKLRFYRLP